MTIWYRIYKRLIYIEDEIKTCRRRNNRMMMMKKSQSEVWVRINGDLKTTMIKLTNLFDKIDSGEESESWLIIFHEDMEWEKEIFIEIRILHDCRDYHNKRNIDVPKLAFIVYLKFIMEEKSN